MGTTNYIPKIRIQDPVCACENVIAFDQSICENNYVEGRKPLDKDGKKNICWSKLKPETKQKRYITYFKHKRPKNNET